MCQLNWIELLISISASALISYFVSIWASTNFEKRKAKRERKRLSDIHKQSEGYFENYNYNDEKITHKVADAKLEYIGENLFTIIVTTYLDGNANKLALDAIQKWKGRAYMDGIRNGSITYHFFQPEYKKDEFGFKRIIISPDRRNIVLYGEGGHGTEKFERKKES